ncbi:GGDEF domain-containing protein [Aquabacterium sp.]|uniref:GGDEF domain-containing protein n=1 Tax=Aquabacterium sp. TaxID=1872578 RepID=UPI0026D5F4EE|nr:GGDEF domain-containing protein [Aquabacterium sp.]
MILKLGGVRVRLWLATALPAMLVIALLVVGFASQYGGRMAEALKDRGAASARQLGSAAEFSLFAGDREALARLAEAALRSDVQLRGVIIYNAQGQVKAAAGQMRAPSPRLDGAIQIVQTKDALVVAQPIYSTQSMLQDDVYGPVAGAPEGFRATENRLLGYAVVEMSLEALAQQRRDLLIWSLATAVGGLMLAGVMASVLADLVSVQIGRINHVVQRVGEGQLDERVDVERSGILRPLATGINAMVARIATTQEELQQQITQATQELRDQKDAAELAARTDSLTGVASRRAFSEAAEAEMQRALRYRSELSLLMMDLDHFKVVNDTHGHVTGDAVLVSFAQTVQQLVRKVDLVARLGGEEFVVLLPNITADQATALAERIREAVYNSHLLVDGQPLQFSVSIGVAQFDRRELSLTGWLARADAALYQAKAQGRNRVVLEMSEV